MATSTRKTTKQTLRSTDRGGVISLSAGILSLALGFGMLLGLTLQTSSSSVLALKNLALGLGGVLYFMVPVFAIWIGALLCVSARHYVSVRSFLLSFGFFLALGAFLILVTSIAGFGTLMDYIHNMNANIKRSAEPGSFGQYLARAFEQYDKKLTPLQGGGALGMLVAFPVWRFLGQVGGLIFLSLCLLALGFALLSINPARLIARLDARVQGKAPEAPAPAPVEQEGNSPVIDQQEPIPAYQPQTEPYYVEPYDEPYVPPNHEPYQQPSPAAYQPQPAFVPQNPPWQTAPEQVEEGFVAVAADYLEPIDTPLQPVPAARQPRAAVPGQERKPASAASPVQPAASAPIAPPPVAEPQPAPVETPPVVPTPPPAAISPVVEEPAEVVQPKPSAASARQTVQEVGTAPAVPLTGERVPVAPKAAAPQMPRRMDGMARPRAEQKQQAFQLSDYSRPPIRLLSAPPENTQVDTTQEDVERAEKLIQTLTSFNISAEVQQIVHGPAITRFAIRLAEGVNVNRLRNVMDNIAVELLAKSPIRAEIPIPGTPLIGIEVSNEHTTTVFLSEVLGSPKMLEAKSPTAVALGKDITGVPVICELMDMPHLLIAGATGSGKSVCINSIITSLLYRATPRDVRLILVDPKFVELQPYNGVPHLLLPVVVDPKKAVSALEWVCQEMDERYQKLQKLGVRNIDAYNRRLDPQEEPLPRIVVIIDEMSDLMVSAAKIIDEHVKRITAKARAAGICLILATQRPSVDVITGIIKANVPSRIAFQVSSQVDSRTIIDSQGAEKLLGYGDMLYLPRMLSAPKRVQGCFVSDRDVAQVTEYVKSRHQADYNVDLMEHVEKGDKREETGSNGDGGGEDAFDELLPKAIEMAVEAGQMSISMLQRVLRVGYGRAGRLIDEMARRNIISGNEGTKPRKTLITREEYQQLFGDDIGFD